MDEGVASDEVDNSEAAAAFYAEQRQRYPAVPSLRRAPRTVGPGAVGKLARAALRLLVGALLAALVVMALFTLFQIVGGAMLTWRYNIRLLFLLAALFHFGGPFFVGLFGCGLFVLIPAGLDKAATGHQCRDVRVFRAIAIVFTVLGCAAFVATMHALARFADSTTSFAAYRTFSWSFLVGATLGSVGAIALAAGASLGDDCVCPSCGDTNQKTATRAIDLVTFDALRATPLSAAPIALPRSGAARHVELRLHHCARCGTGVLEGTLHLRTHYTTLDGKKEQSETWRCLSTAVPLDAMPPLLHELGA